MRQGVKTKFARDLRKNLTQAEIRLWFHLRRNRLDGFRFRRQHPIGTYIADFLCIEARLIVEADGSQHLQSSRDKTRDEWLRAQGYRILRFWNDDVLNRTDEVLISIATTLASTGPHPPSAPSPVARERGKSGFGVS